MLPVSRPRDDAIIASLLVIWAFAIIDTDTSSQHAWIRWLIFATLMILAARSSQRWFQSLQLIESLPTGAVAEAFLHRLFDQGHWPLSSVLLVMLVMLVMLVASELRRILSNRTADFSSEMPCEPSEAG